jgi:hypothetical protein
MEIATIARAIKELARAKETVLTRVMEMGTSTGMATREETGTETDTAAGTEVEMGRNTVESFARESSPRPVPSRKLD